MTMNAAASPLTDDDILQFLHDHPDFLLRYPNALDFLSLPARSEGENIVDFHQLMVSKLRSDKKRAEDRQRSMIDSARTNMTVQARVHAAVVRLLEAQTIEEFSDMVGNELALMLDVDVVALGLETPTILEIANTNGIRPLQHGTIDAYMDDKNAVLGTNIDGDPNLFGPAARLVKSQALLRLTIADDFPEGLLAFGSRDPLLFADSQGTELIAFLGDVIERILRRFFDAGR